MPRSARAAGHAVRVEGTTIRIVRDAPGERQPARLLPRPGGGRGLGQRGDRAAARAARAGGTPGAPALRRRDRALLAPARAAGVGRGGAARGGGGERAGDRRRRARRARSRSTWRAPGVGRLGIVDDDAVELSNLHRQPLHFTPDIGVPKAESAAAKLRFLNPDVVVEPYQVRVDAENAAALVEGQDLVVDCSDSFATRYAVNAACCAARRAARRGRRARHGRAGDERQARAHRVLPLRVPDRAGRRAALRRRRRARARRGRDRLAPGAGGAEAADRRRAGDRRRLPAGRPRHGGLPARARRARRADCPDCGRAV